MTSTTAALPRRGAPPAASAPAPIVSLAAVTWDFALVGRTRMLTEAWQRRRQQTTFVQVPSLRTALQRFTTLLGSSDEAPVVRPWPAYPCSWWPIVGEGQLGRAIRRRAGQLRRQLDRATDLSEATAIVVSPLWAPWLEKLPFKHVVYDCIDDVAVHVPRPEVAALYRKWEHELVQRASGAVVTAEPLRETLRVRRPDLPISTIRNGVDVERFARLAKSSPRPADLPDGKRPIVGFVGALYEWIDWKLIEQVVRALSEFDFVFVGPHDGRGSTETLVRFENVSFLGARPYERVPAYVNAFDVCWVPFDQSRVSKAANPVKIYEYLALGKPVVSTPVADTESFDGHVLVGRDAGEIAERLREALDSRAGCAPERVRFARANSWDVRAAEYVDFVTALPG